MPAHRSIHGDRNARDSVELETAEGRRSSGLAADARLHRAHLEKETRRSCNTQKTSAFVPVGGVSIERVYNEEATADQVACGQADLESVEQEVASQAGFEIDMSSQPCEQD